MKILLHLYAAMCIWKLEIRKMNRGRKEEKNKICEKDRLNGLQENDKERIRESEEIKMYER